MLKSRFYNKKNKVIVIFLMFFSVICIAGCIFYSNHKEQDDVLFGEKGREVYEIASESDWIDFADSTYNGCDYLGKTVYLTADLDYGEIEKEADERDKKVSPQKFRGVFNGQGHTISNLVVVSSYSSGLFSQLMGTVANLQIIGGVSQGEEGAGAFTDILDGGSIVNCCAYIDIVGPTINGIYGIGEGIVDNCVTNYNYTSFSLSKLNRRISAINFNSRVAVDKYFLWEMGEEKPVLSEALAPTRITMNLSPERCVEMYYSDIADKYICPIPAGFYISSSDYSFNLEYENDVVEYIPNYIDEKYWFDWGGNIYEIEFIPAGNVPTLFIDVADEMGVEWMQNTKDIYFNGSYSLYSNEGKRLVWGGVKEMASRGHNSFLYSPKVGFRLNLDQPKDLFGMGSDRHWVLIPAARNNSFLTYMVYHDMAEAVGFGDCPDQVAVQLFCNDKYQGLYFLSERIEIEKNRLDLSDRITINNERSFVVEVFIRSNDKGVKHPFINAGSDRYILRYPREATPSQTEAIIDYITKADNALKLQGKPDEYGKTFEDYIDLESYAKQWLMYYFAEERSIASSVYFYRDIGKDSDQKLHAIRPWDVEHSFYSVENDIGKDSMYNDKIDEEDRWIKSFTAPNYMRELVDNPIFINKANQIWQEEFLPSIKGALDPQTGYVEDGLSYIGWYVDNYKQANILDNTLIENLIEDKAEIITEFFDKRSDYITADLSAQ